jgi:hypothetical protein
MPRNLTNFSTAGNSPSASQDVRQETLQFAVYSHKCHAEIHLTLAAITIMYINSIGIKTISIPTPLIDQSVD